MRELNQPVCQHLMSLNTIPRQIIWDLCERVRDLNFGDGPGWFAELVAHRIADTGKHVDDLTIKELREIVQECDIAANAAAKNKLYCFGPLK